MAHPDAKTRQLGLRRLRVVAEAAAQLGTPADLLETMQEALSISTKAGVVLAIEPESANVVSDARRARSAS